MTENKDEFYFEIILKSLANAKQFHLDTIELSKIKSYGHAYALAVLGFEEIAKAWGVLYLQFGLYQEDDEFIRELFRNHITKQFAGWQTFSMIFLHFWEEFVKNSKYKDKLEEISVIDDNGKLQLETYKKELWDLILDMSIDDNKEISNAANQFIKLKQILDDLSSNNFLMNDRKLLGFYINVEFKNNIVKGPETFTKDNLELIDTLGSFIEISEISIKNYQQNINNPIFIQYKEFVKKLMQKVRELDI